MPTTRSVILSLAACFLTYSPTSAIPSPAFVPSNLAVLIRQPDFSYNHSSTMAATIVTNAPSFNLSKRSYAKVQACYTSSCTDCRVVWDGTFSSSTSCISADNTACLIISNMDDANVEFWNHAGCNGKNTVFRGCGDGDTQKSAPGTNSLGVHKGC